MNSKGHKFVRFEDWGSEASFSLQQQNPTHDGFHSRKLRPSLHSVLEAIRKRMESGSERIKSLKKPSRFHPSGDGAVKKVGYKSTSTKTGRTKILDPQGPLLQKWNKIFVLSCFIAVSLDPLFFYIPEIDHQKQCLALNGTLQITACVLRTFFDIFYILRIVFQFRTGFIAPSSRVFGRGELVDDPHAIAKRYLSSNFIIDILSILPLPQVVILAVIPSLKDSVPFVTKDLLKCVIFAQYVPRLIRIHPLFKQVKTTSGILAETAWAAAAFNLFLYMLASNAVGAFWYLFSIEAQLRCWRRQMDDHTILTCGNIDVENFSEVLRNSCGFVDPDQINDSETFNFGIFIDALKSGVVQSTTDFHNKFLYCFWWGLRNVSSLGQNLNTSTYAWEIIFAIFISIFGLVLFSLLIGNMQKYLQSTSVRVEEMRVKRRDAEQWMSHRMLPDNLRDRIRRYEQYKWQQNRGVEEENLIRNLPKDIRRDIKRHLCISLLMRVPMFEKMDGQLLDAMSDGLKPVLYTENSCIVREGDPVDEMLFIMRGSLATMTTNGGRTGFFNSFALKAGDFCGEELLTWALDPNSSANFPISTRTVETLSEVEAFALSADDLKTVANSQFRRLHSKQLKHTFRFYSMQWKTWAACFIQIAWRRYCKRKLDRNLREAEDRLQDALANEVGTSPSLGATIFVSRFAANAMRTLRQAGARNSRVSPRPLQMLPQKPAEPNFHTQEH